MMFTVVNQPIPNQHFRIWGVLRQLLDNVPILIRDTCFIGSNVGDKTRGTGGQAFSSLKRAVPGAQRPHRSSGPACPEDTM